MDLFNDLSKAYSNATRRFVLQKSDEPVYIYRVLVARREMWAVLSAAEIAANKVSVNSCYTAVDGRYGLLEAKNNRQRMLEHHPKLALEMKAIRGWRQYHKAKQELFKMERGAVAPERPTKLDTTEA